MNNAITNALPDIPRLYTALSEWLACIIYLSVIPLRTPLKRTITISAVGLAAIIGIQYLAGSMPLGLWILGMCLAVTTMWLMIWLASGSAKRLAWYVTMRAFVLAELAASLHWQIDSFIRSDSRSPFAWQSLVILTVIYAACFALARMMERHNFNRNEAVTLTTRDAVSCAAITITTFAVSNLSFVSTNTPFSGTLGQEVFYIRTLVDFCGFVILYAQQEQLQRMQSTLELAEINTSLASQHAEYLQSKENLEVMSRLAHDLKHQIVALRAELDPERASAQFEQLENSVARTSAQQHSGNPVLNVVLTTKMRTCADRGITFTCVADGKLLDGMESMDIATLFGNALDNAIEATSKLTDAEQRLIRVALHQQGQFALVRVENYYDTTLRHAADGSLTTTKSDTGAHGFGVKSIRHIARQYGGEVTINPHDHWFDLRALLPLPLCKQR